MTANWIHVAVVHLAVIGAPWLLYRVLAHGRTALDSAAWKTTYTGSIIIGIVAAIGYFTGPHAADWAQLVVDGYSQDHVEDHALWGRIAFVVQGIVALIGVMGWASILQGEAPDRRLPPILIVLLSINTLVMIYTAHLGGLVRRMDLMP
ncbi:MAG: hypothetical protein KDB88_12170 [Flavobacteriales bacterium]|nr:hypothetical protein [Flavobacteriales bacterium]MCB0795485.1 hypothetical protein [Flavobacteriales bacterium]